MYRQISFLHIFLPSYIYFHELLHFLYPAIFRNSCIIKTVANTAVRKAHMPQIIMAMAHLRRNAPQFPYQFSDPQTDLLLRKHTGFRPGLPCGPSSSYHEKAASAPIHLYTYKQDNYSPFAGILQIPPVLFYNADIFSYFYKTMFYCMKANSFS